MTDIYFLLQKLANYRKKNSHWYLDFFYHFKWNKGIFNVTKKFMFNVVLQWQVKILALKAGDVNRQPAKSQWGSVKLKSSQGDLL